MADLYPNFAALAAARQQEVDYRLLLRTPPGSRLAHLAIHGGGIEPGTLEVADYLAGSASRFYALDSMLVDGVLDLALGDEVFDEPQALATVAASDFVVSWRGTAGEEPLTYVGGLDTDAGNRVRVALEGAGFAVQSAPAEYAGADPANLCNRNARAMGVYITLTVAQRRAFFEDFSRAGRELGARTSEFYAYVGAVQAALVGLDVPRRPAGSQWEGRVASPSSRTGEVSGDFGIPALAPLTVDGMPMDSVKDSLRLVHARQMNGSTSERFWSTPPRPNGDRTREVFEWALSSPQLVNRMAFSLARFPQRAWAQYRSADGVWHPLLQAGTGAPVQISVMDSLPAVIPTGVSDGQKLHPQHFGAGHWMPQMVDVEPVRAARFRIVMTRIPSSGSPRDLGGEYVPYSLGVKDALVSCRVGSPSDLPWLPQESDEHTQPIAGSSDRLGSQVEYLLRRTRASSLLPPASGVWRCAPQPVPNAVVSLYLDVRTATGEGQVMDRIWTDPLTPGVSVNVYFAEDTVVPERFAGADTPLTLPFVRPSSPPPVADASGVLFDSALSYLDIDNRAALFEPDEPFLLSMIVHPQLTSTDEGRMTALDCGPLTVWIEQGVVTVRLDQRTVDIGPVTYGVNDRLPLAVAYDGERLTVRGPGATAYAEHAFVVDAPPPAVLRLGGQLAGAGGNLRVRSLLLARGRARDIESIEAYWDDPAGYALPPGYGGGEAAHTSANALLRLDPSLITPGADSVCPWGLIGGAPISHTEQVWTPIPGDFTLRRGLLKFRPVKARHLKLEFTNLQPTPVTPTSQAHPMTTTRMFPSPQSSGVSTVVSGASQSGAAPTGARVAVDQGAVYRFADAPVGGEAAVSSAAYLPTEALYAPDPVDAQMLRRSGQRFPYQPLPATRAPRFSTTGVHRYHEVELAMDTRLAYTVALAEVLVYLADPAAERDTEQYVELFHDTAYLAAFEDGLHGHWRHTGSAMITEEEPPFLGSRLTSKTFVSKRRVLGVQFAAQATDAQQLVADPDFSDPSLHSWRSVGDATLAPSDAYAASVGQMAHVARGHAMSSWSAMEQQYMTWGAIEASNPLPNRPLWWEVENATSESDVGGVESLRPVTPAPGGRLYAAARVQTEGALAQPLLLQLVTGDGRILAEAAQEIPAAQVSEWYVGATIRTSAPAGSTTWDAVSANGSRTWAQVEQLGDWSDVTQDFDLDDVRDVRVRLVQEGEAGTGEWLVDSLAIYQDPLIWEVTRDGGVTWHEMAGIRNNPRGVFLFPDLPATDRTGGTQLRWRVTGYASNLSLSSVVLRPWYATLSGAVPYQDTLQASGAASALADYYPPVDADPLFQGWSHPIPEDWWLAYRQWMQQNYPRTQPLPSIILPETVAAGTDEGAPPGQARHALTPAFVITR